MMFFRNKISKLGSKLSQKHEQLSTANTLSEEDMVKKLRQYQKRTYLNQELSRRRSIERFYGAHLDDSTRDRAQSAPLNPPVTQRDHPPLMRVESDVLPRKRFVQRTDSVQSDDYIACGMYNKRYSDSTLRRQVTFKQTISKTDQVVQRSDNEITNAGKQSE